MQRYEVAESIKTTFRVTLAGLLFAAVFSFASPLASGDAGQRLDRLCDGPMVVSTLEPSSTIQENEGPSANARLAGEQVVADGDPDYCAGCDCSEEVCALNCSKCW